MLEHTNHHTAHEIDYQNHDAGNRVSAHKLRGTVHGTKEVRFLRHIGTPCLRLVLLNDSGIEVRVNGHLLTRHRVQGKAGGYFSHTSRALGDHDKVNDGDHNKDHDTNSKVATN